MEPEDDFVDEWTRYAIQLPEDDFDEDDELDLRIFKAEQKKKHHIVRGDSIFGI